MDNTRELVKARIEAEKNLMAELEDESNKDPAPSQFVRDCLMRNELGDGMLFARLLRDKYVFNSACGEMMVWTGHSWTQDKKRSYLGAVDVVARRYLMERKKILEENQNV